MKVEVLQAWPRRFRRCEVELPVGACVADALRAAGWEHEPDVVGYAVFGIAADLQTPLHEGDRIELLRPLQADPKEARRRRAQGGRGRPENAGPAQRHGHPGVRRDDRGAE